MRVGKTFCSGSRGRQEALLCPELCFWSNPAGCSRMQPWQLGWVLAVAWQVGDAGQAQEGSAQSPALPGPGEALFVLAAHWKQVHEGGPKESLWVAVAGAGRKGVQDPGREQQESPSKGAWCHMLLFYWGSSSLLELGPAKLQLHGGARGEEERGV